MATDAHLEPFHKIENGEKYAAVGRKYRNQ